MELVWYSQLPAWVSEITDATELTSVIENHIKNVAGRYAGKLYAWVCVHPHQLPWPIIVFCTQELI